MANNTVSQYRQAIGLFNKVKITVHVTAIGFRCVTMLSLFLLFVLFMLLLLCGDIAENPGPTFNIKSLSACHINIRGLNESKIRALKTLVCNVYDVITLSETFLSDTSSVDLDLPGYHSIIRRDRQTFGGGIAVYVRDNLVFKRRIEFECRDLENLWIELCTCYGKLIICTAYRPPGFSDFWNQFELNIESVKDVCDDPNILILGDLNADFNVPSGQKLRELCQLHNLVIHITEPTRITATTASCLDQIITNIPNCVKGVSVDPPLCTNDHCTVGVNLTLKIPKEPPYFRHVWLYDKADCTSFKQALTDFDWNSCFENTNISEACELWTESFLNIARTFIPNKVVQIRPNDVPWYSTELRRLKRRVIRIFRKAKCVNTTYQWNRYKELNREYKEKLEKAEHEFYKAKNESLCSVKNDKKWWKTVNEILGRNKKDNFPPIFNATTNLYASNNHEKTRLFNEFFLSNNRLDLSKATLPQCEIDANHPTLTDVVATEQEVHDYIKTIDIKKATGPDGISPRLLKIADLAIVPSLTKLINCSLMNKKVPELWKKANVIPLHKKNIKEDVNNYRPVSILSTVSKIIEKVIFKKVYNFLHTNRLLTDNQSGFRPKDSTINQLAYLYHTFSEALDKKKEIRVVFCDISKAFDKVWHEGLIYKLSKLGIRGNILEWFKDYLQFRKQRVVIKGEKSDWGVIGAGVPQGSVLGPLLFLIYINDIVECIDCGIKLFADDTILHLEFDNPEMATNKLNKNLDNISKWANDWLVKFSEQKTKAMNISLKPNTQVLNFPLIFNGVPLEEVKEHKHLGITLNNKLKWTDHINNIINSVTKISDVFRSLKYKLDRRTLETIYLSFVRPKLEYGNILYDDCTEQNSSLLEKVQLTFARIICGAIRGTPHCAIYNEMSWPTLEDRRKENKLKFMHKLVYSDTPSYLANLLPKPADDNQYNLRNSQNQKQFNFRTTKFKNSLLPNCIELWNKLDNETRLISNNSEFKTKITNVAFRNPLFNGHKRSLNLIHSKLRMKCSNLNSHLYDLHVIDSPQCVCMSGIEDCFHYFFQCPLYNVERQRLIFNVEQLCNVSLNVVLYGNESLSIDENLTLFQHVECYIHETNRFATSPFV